MKPRQININDLYFGIVVEDFNQIGKGDFLTTANLFNSSRVKSSVARWVTSDEKFKKEHDFLHWCFGDVWGRTQYEFVVCPWGGLSNEDRVVEVGQKVDTFRMYVEPNAKLLRQMVNSVSVASAKRYLSANKTRGGKK